MTASGKPHEEGRGTPGRGAQGQEAGLTTFSALVADDNPAVRGLVGTALRLSSHCHQVHFARSGREAVEVWRRETPDVILMDLRMPDMDGAAAVRQIRPRDPTVCIVVMSASQVGEMDVELAGLPVDAVIEKGMEPGDLGSFLARLQQEKRRGAASS